MEDPSYILFHYWLASSYRMYGDILFLPFDQSLKAFRDINFQDLRDIADHVSTLYVDPNDPVTDVNRLSHENCMPGRCTTFAASLMDRSSWPIANPDPMTWPERARKLKGVRVQARGAQDFTLTEVRMFGFLNYIDLMSDSFSKGVQYARMHIRPHTAISLEISHI